LEIAGRFPHSHRLDDESPCFRHRTTDTELWKGALLGPGHPGVSSRLIFQLECAE
jgi:hypothetical protein